MGVPQQPAPQQNDKIELRIVHGHLAFARFPVLAGHYDGDTFAGTEAALDRALDSRLSERRRMGLYPGEIGTSAVLLDPNSRPCGAVVVGLGQPTDLSVGLLRRTLRHGLLAFVVGKLDQRRQDPGPNGAETRLGLSAVLVGAGDGGLDRASCVQAMLQAASEAQAVVAGLGTTSARLGPLEIIERYADRADATWRAADEAIKSDSVLSRGFELAPDVERRGGGRDHASRGREATWWQPIQITMPDDPQTEERSLSFAIGGGLARAEARTVAANLDLVRPLLRRAFRNIDLDGAATSPGRTLFELLWPDSLKDRSGEEGHRRLILDERSAAFPWEMLDDRRPWILEENGARASDVKPPAVRSGMVRQLLQSRFREQFAAPRSRKALVIGDPSAVATEGFPKLPGAEAEANAIVAKLKAKDRQVTALIGGAASPEQVCKQLFTQAWEIVHISAHGVVDQELTGSDGRKRRMTGIVLGGGVVLGPSALARLPVSPSIVFVNCCHLGRIDAALEDQAREASQAGRPEFAASVAVELIKLGVRCVIVAGWAVDDDAAAAFGETFYDAMLRGASFGEATLQARQKAYDTRPDSNTWGAYQCYGDPDTRLRFDGPKPDDLATIAGAIEAARQISEDVNIGIERDLDAQRSRVDRIEDEARRRNWLGSAQLRIALAEARRELGDLPGAIEHFAAVAIGAEGADSVTAGEQLANLRARDAVATFRKGPREGRDPAPAVAAIEASLRSLRALTETHGGTVERLALQGACWKRLAQVQASSPAADSALENMATCYDRAAAIGGSNDYPRFMACSARICIAARKGTDVDASVGETLQRLADTALPDDADFWLLIQSADARLNLAIMQATAPSQAKTAPSEDTKREIEAVYRRAWRDVGSPVKLRSVVEQLTFYEDILAYGAPETALEREGVVEWVATLRQVLETEFLGKQTDNSKGACHG